MQLPQWLGKIGYRDQVQVIGARGVRWEIVAICSQSEKSLYILRRRLGFLGKNLGSPSVYFSYS